MLANPPRPRCPTTSRSASADSSISTVAACPGTTRTSTGTVASAPPPFAITSRTVCSMIGFAASASCWVDGGTKTLGGVILQTPGQVSGVWNAMTARTRADRRAASSSANSNAVRADSGPVHADDDHTFGTHLVLCFSGARTRGPASEGSRCQRRRRSTTADRPESGGPGGGECVRLQVAARSSFFGRGMPAGWRCLHPTPGVPPRWHRPVWRPGHLREDQFVMRARRRPARPGRRPLGRPGRCTSGGRPPRRWAAS